MIIVKNRQLLFSNREDYLGTPYDSGSTNRVFRLERINEDGTDLAKLDFNIDLKYMKDLSTDTAMLEKTEDDRYVYLTWNISDLPAAKEGTIKINLRGKDISGLIKWSSYQNVVYFEPTGSPITPSEEALTELEQYESSLKQLTDNLNLSETQRQEAESERVTAEEGRVNAENERQQQFDEAMSEFNEDREELQGYVTAAGNSAEAAAGSASAAAGSAGEAAGAASTAVSAKDAAETARDQAQAAASAKVDNSTIKRDRDGAMYADDSVIVKTDNTTIGKDDSGNLKLLATASNINAADKYNMTGDTPDPTGASTTEVMLQLLLDKYSDQIINKLVSSEGFQSKLMEYIVNNGSTNQAGFALDARQGNPNVEGSLAAQLTTLTSGLKEYKLFSGPSNSKVQFPISTQGRYMCVVGGYGSNGADSIHSPLLFFIEIGYSISDYRISSLNELKETLDLSITGSECQIGFTDQSHYVWAYVKPLQS